MAEEKRSTATKTRKKKSGAKTNAKSPARTATKDNNSAPAVDTNSGVDFSVRASLAGKTIMIVGGTGFLGRIMLYMLLKNAPEVGRLVLVIRATHGRSGRDRLEHEILGSPVFTEDAAEQERFRALFDEKVEVVEGDAARAGIGIDPETAERLYQQVDLVLNTAGNVEFNPPLDASLAANTLATREVLNFVEKTASKKYLHVSTCYVADRSVHRDLAPEEIVSDRVINAEGNEVLVDPDNEITASLAAVEAIKSRPENPGDAERFRERAVQELRRSGKDPSDRMIEKIAKGLRTFEQREELIKAGRRRAARLNRPNVYTYTKTLAELLVKSRRDRIDYTIVRPSIVETSVRYPFAGWNEGIQGSAPLIYLMYRGHIMLPSFSNEPGERRVATLDIIPVDQVAGGTILAAAALLSGRHREVYQLAGGPRERPVTPNVLLNIVQVALREKIRSENKGVKRLLRENIQGYPVSKEVFNRFSSPRMLKFLEKARDRIEKIPGGRLPPQGEKLLRKASEEVDRFYKISYLKNRIFDEFLPFMNHGYPTFANMNARELCNSLPGEERDLFPFYPNEIDYVRYLSDDHMNAVVRWIFPVLEKRFNAIMNAGSGKDSLEVAMEAAREMFKPSRLRSRARALAKKSGRVLRGASSSSNGSAGSNGEPERTPAAADRDDGGSDSATVAGGRFAFVDHSLRVLGRGRKIQRFADESDEFLRELGDHLEMLTGAYFSADMFKRLGTPARLKEHLADRESQRAESRREKGLGALVQSGSLPADGMRVNPTLAEPTRDFLRKVQMYFYKNVLRVKIEGAENIPLNNNHVIVVANHCSHLDYGLVWYGLGGYARDIGIIAARDYFFNKFWKSTFFHNFHNLIPLDREAESYAQAFEPAFQFISRGGPLLIFPEGTRSVDGQLQEFKQGLGYLVKKAEADVLPLRLGGTYEALPRGKNRLKGRDVSVKIGRLIPYEDLRAATEGASPTRAMHTITRTLQKAVEDL